MDFPEVKLPFLDRILVTCEMYDIPAVIVVNKTDLYDGALTARLEDFRRIYEGAGYPVMAVSAKTGEGGGRTQEDVRRKPFPVLRSVRGGEVFSDKGSGPVPGPKDRRHFGSASAGEAYHHFL